MSHLIASAPTRPPAFREHDTIDHDTTDHIAQDSERARSRIWTLLEALAYAGAYIDPSGVLAVQRLRQAEEEEERNAR
jgi:hypothetical protein